MQNSQSVTATHIREIDNGIVWTIDHVMVDLLLVEVRENETLLSFTATQGNDGIHGNGTRVAMDTWSLVLGGV